MKINNNEIKLNGKEQNTKEKNISTQWNSNATGS